MSSETPTESASPAASAGSARSRTALIVVSIIAALLLLAVTVLLTLFFSGLGKTDDQPAPSIGPSPSTSASPSESPSPSAEPESEPSATPSESPTPPSPPAPPAPPVATGPTFTSFSPANNKSVGCSGSDGSVPVTFTWASTGANEAAFGVGTTDAFTGALETGLPPSGSFTWDYQCGNETQTYTVSIRGTSGQTNKTITLRR